MVDILVRNVSPELHRALKIKAAARGETLSQTARILLEVATIDPQAEELDWRASRMLDKRDEDRVLSELERAKKERT